MARQPVAAEDAGGPVRNTTLDLAHMSVRDVNRLLHAASQGDFLIKNPRGLHAIVAGLDGDLTVSIDGHVGVQRGLIPLRLSKISAMCPPSTSTVTRRSSFSTDTARRPR